MMPQCFFIGHRDAPPELMPMLQAEVERHIVKLGVTDFLVGSHGNFDSLAAAAVISAKKAFPHISLYRLLAYHPAERCPRLSDGFDGSYYPEGMESVPRQFAITHANRRAVQESDFLIAYAVYPGSAKTLAEYALRRKEIQVTLLPHP